MKAPAVSGVQSCLKLCLAMRNEEKWLLELKKDYSIVNLVPPLFTLLEQLTHPMVLRGEGHVMHNHPRPSEGK